jgi:ferredoxin
VDKVKTVVSDECTSCFNCLDACPVKDTLYLETVKPKFKISKKSAAIGIAILYLLVIGIGIVTGNWQNDITEEEYFMYYNQRNSINHFEEGTGLENFNRQIKPVK